MTKLTESQKRVLSYVGECGKAPPKCQIRTIDALREAGFIVGWSNQCWRTHAGSAALGQVA